METPPPSVPEDRLVDWRQTDQRVDSPFSTPMVSVCTHTVVFEESTQRAQIRERIGVDHPWRFFFTSRIQLEPPHPPNPILTSLIRQQVDHAFADRLADRGLVDIHKGESHSVSLGPTRGKRRRFAARLELDTDQGHISVPIEAYVAVWVDDDYRLAGGAYPAGRGGSGSSEFANVLINTIEPKAAREELFGLIASCAES